MKEFRFGVEQLEASLRENFSSSYRVERINAQKIIKGHWVHEARLIIFPGGRDKPYQKKLSPLGNLRIKRFVRKGGSYLGICAGSYYAGTRVEFALDDPYLRVAEDRDLGLFPGTVRGPMYLGFTYGGSRGVRAAVVNHSQHIPADFPRQMRLYYNGGGYFIDTHKYKDIRVLATYPGPEGRPAIVEARVGDGKAILSALHVEYRPSQSGSRRHLRRVDAELLSQSTEGRNRSFARTIT